MAILDPTSFDGREIELSTDSCIKCNVCQSYCPVLNVTDLFPGPKYVGPQAQRLRIGSSVDRTVDYCSGCTVCTRVCPSGVKYGHLVEAARDQIQQVEEDVQPPHVKAVRGAVFDAEPSRSRHGADRVADCSAGEMAQGASVPGASRF